MRRVWSNSTWCDLETQIIVSADRMRTFPGALLIPQAAWRTLTFVRNLLGLGQGHLNRKLRPVFYCPGASMMSRRAALARFFWLSFRFPTPPFPAVLDISHWLSCRGR